MSAPRVYGGAFDLVQINGMTMPQWRYVPVPEGALAAVSEGFCPDCTGTALAGDTGRWCPSCMMSWNIVRGEAP